MVYSDTMGKMNGKSGHLSIFTSLKHLMMLSKRIFSGLHFYTLSKNGGKWKHC